MKKSSLPYFRYPSNINVLDLATLVSMYRDRGAPRKADPGKYFICAYSNKLIKEAKWWFGGYYSQTGWNKMLTQGCEGFPLTEVELNVLGHAYIADEVPPDRSYVEKNAGALEKMAFMIVNDLKGFGFLSIDEQDRLLITPRGENALQGIAEQMYQRKFNADMLRVNRDGMVHPTIEKATKKDTEQTNLF